MAGLEHLLDASPRDICTTWKGLCQLRHQERRAQSLIRNQKEQRRALEQRLVQEMQHHHTTTLRNGATVASLVAKKKFVNQEMLQQALALAWGDRNLLEGGALQQVQGQLEHLQVHAVRLRSNATTRCAAQEGGHAPLLEQLVALLADLRRGAAQARALRQSIKQQQQQLDAMCSKSPCLFARSPEACMWTPVTTRRRARGHSKQATSCRRPRRRALVSLQEAEPLVRRALMQGSLTGAVHSLGMLPPRHTRCPGGAAVAAASRDDTVVVELEDPAPLEPSPAARLWWRQKAVAQGRLPRLPSRSAQHHLLVYSSEGALLAMRLHAVARMASTSEGTCIRCGATRGLHRSPLNSGESHLVACANCLQEGHLRAADSQQAARAACDRCRYRVADCAYPGAVFSWVPRVGQRAGVLADPSTLEASGVPEATALLPGQLVVHELVCANCQMP